MRRKSILLLHWDYLKKDTIGEINFCVNKFINAVYESVTTLLSLLILIMGGGEF